MTGLEALEKVKRTIKAELAELDLMGFEKSDKYNYLEQLLNELTDVEKSLKALEVLKKLFNPEKYNFLELYENPFITIGKKGEKYRIDSTDDSYIHIGIPKEEFDLLKEVLE